MGPGRLFNTPGTFTAAPGPWLLSSTDDPRRPHGLSQLHSHRSDWMPLECSFLVKPLKIYPSLQKHTHHFGVGAGVHELVNDVLKGEFVSAPQSLGMNHLMLATKCRFQ